MPEPTGYVEGEEIAGLNTPTFRQLYAIWHDWKVLSVLPHGKGTLDERPIVVKWIKAFETEHAALQQWMMDRDKEKLPVCRAGQKYS